MVQATPHIDLARHRAMMESYERALNNVRERAAEAAEAYANSLSDERMDNKRLLCQNISRKNQLERIEEKNCTPWWAIVWTTFGALCMLLGLVCLSLIVWP